MSDVSRENYDADIATMQMRVDMARKEASDLRAQLAAVTAERDAALAKRAALNLRREGEAGMSGAWRPK